MLPFFREVHEARHIQTLVPRPTFDRGQTGAVVGEPEDDRVLGEAVILELLQDRRGLPVHRRDVVVIARPFAAELGDVGVNRRNYHLRLIVNRRWRRQTLGGCLFVATKRLALVRDHVVEHGEERLPGLATAPVRLGARLVPRGLRRREVVVLLHVVRRIVAGLAQVLGKQFHRGGQRHVRPHVVAAEMRRIDAGDKRRARRRAHAGVGIGAAEADVLLREAIEVWRHGEGIAVGAHEIARVLERDPEDVRTGLRGAETQGAGQRGEDGQDAEPDPTRGLLGERVFKSHDAEERGQLTERKLDFPGGSDPGGVFRRVPIGSFTEFHCL